MAGPRLSLWIGLALATLPSLAAAQPSGQAARVNGIAIPMERLERAFDELLASQGRSAAAIRNPATYKRLRREALAELVDEELLWQEAERAGLRASPEEAAQALAQARARARTPGAFQQALSRRGLTEEDYLAQLGRQLAIRRLLAREAGGASRAASDEEVHAYYEAHPELFASPEGEVREAIRQRLLVEKSDRALRERIAALRAVARIELLAEP